MARSGAMSRAMASLSTGLRAHRLDEADPVHQLPQLVDRHRGGHVRSEHPAAHRHVDFDDLGAERRRREPGIDRAGVIGQADGAAVALAEERHHVQPDAFRRTRIRGRALQDGERHAGAAHAVHGLVELGQIGLMPLDSRTGRPVAIIASSSGSVADLARRPPSTSACPTRASRSTASSENGELRKTQPASRARGPPGPSTAPR